MHLSYFLVVIADRMVRLGSDSSKGQLIMELNCVLVFMLAFLPSSIGFILFG